MAVGRHVKGQFRLELLRRMPCELSHQESRPKAVLTRRSASTISLPPAPPFWCVERRLWPYQGDDW